MDNRIYRLDLLRAIAIMTVFTAHTVLSFGAPSHLSWMQFGGTGVDLFFVLSGWLIGSQLFKELERYGDIDVKRFWIRRWMRTLPAYYAVLIFTIIQLSITKDDFSFPWKYFVFLQNYDTPLTFFTVSWSLSVEEQFYLAIAPILLFLSKFSASQRTIVLIVLILLPTLFRHIDPNASMYETHVRWDCCIMGIFLAHLKYSYQKLWSTLLDKAPMLLTIGITAYIFFYINRISTNIELSDPSKLTLAIVFGFWVIWANQREQKQLFGHSIIMYISTRSYAIYLLHPDALALTKRLFNEQHFVIYFAIAFAASCLASEVLYRMIEQPIMKARSKFKWSCSRSRVKEFMLEKSHV